MDMTPMMMSAMESERVANRMIDDLRATGSADFSRLEWETMYDYDKQRVMDEVDRLDVATIRYDW